MYTANDLKKDLSEENQSIEENIDRWLKQTVRQSFQYSGQGFEVPSELRGVNIKSRLEERGFTVTDYSGYQGYFVYLSIKD